MSEPRNWSSEFSSYGDFLHWKSADATVTLDMDVRALNETMAQLEGLQGESRALTMTVALELLRRIAMRTPVRTGRLRNSFHVVGPGERDEYSYSDNQGHSFDGILSEEPGENEALVGTNVIYALAIEAGHSRQAPQGMVAISVAEMQGALETKIQEMLDKLNG